MFQRLFISKMVVKYKIVEICDQNVFGLLTTKSDVGIIVPSLYVTKTSTGDCYVKYLKPPYSDDDIGLIKDFIGKCTYPLPTSWVDYKCTVVANCSGGKKISLLTLT